MSEGCGVHPVLEAPYFMGVASVIPMGSCQLQGSLPYGTPKCMASNLYLHLSQSGYILQSGPCLLSFIRFPGKQSNKVNQKSNVHAKGERVC